jgi:hypothetical protein
MVHATGMTRQTIAQHLDTLGIDPVETRQNGRVKRYPMEALEQIRPLKRKSAHKGDPLAGGSENIDPDTGLTWAQARMREETLEKRMAREDEERRQSDEWIDAESHSEALASIVSRLEQLPGRFRSELGLSDAQEVALRRALDQIRNEAAEEVETKKPKCDNSPEPTADSHPL